MARNVVAAGLLAALFAGCSSLPTYTRTGSLPADLAIVNADVVTCDANNTRAQAVAAKDGRIVFVGSNEAAAEFIGPQTRLINADGEVLTPGFVDNHCHSLWISALAPVMTKDFYKCKTFEEFQAAVLKQAADNPDLPLVSGIGWNYSYIPSGAPTKEMLDAIIADRPTMLWPIDAQCIWVNTKALNLMRERNQEAFEEMLPNKDAKTGEYTGTFRHSHTFSPLDYFTEEELRPVRPRMLQAMKDLIAEALSFGVTTMDDLQIYRSFVPYLLDLKKEGGFKDIRVRGTMYVGPHALKDEAKLKEKFAWWKEVGARENDAHFILGQSLKFYIDGTVGNHTALLSQPYLDEPNNYGEALWTQEKFDLVMDIIDGMGLQAYTHSIGDAGINRVLNSYEKVREKSGRDARHVVIHCELPSAEDLARMARLKIPAGMEPALFYADGVIEKALGLERLQKYNPWKTMEKMGITIAFGSDYPAPQNPIYGLLIAVLRVNEHGDDTWGPDEAIDVLSAIRHWTIDSAYARFLEKDLGSIEVGKLADLALMDARIISLGSLGFLLTHDIEVGKLDDFCLMTVVDGRIVYQRPGAELGE
jgi:hypothetical protein